MALKSGRVGVAPDQVDVYGRVTGAASNMETRVNEEGKPQWREKGTEEWQNFSGGVAEYIFDEDFDRSITYIIGQDAATPLADEYVMTLYKNSLKENPIEIKLPKTNDSFCAVTIRYNHTTRSQLYCEYNYTLNGDGTGVGAWQSYSNSSQAYYSYTSNNSTDGIILMKIRP